MLSFLATLPIWTTFLQFYFDLESLVANPTSSSGWVCSLESLVANTIEAAIGGSGWVGNLESLIANQRWEKQLLAAGPFGVNQQRDQSPSAKMQPTHLLQSFRSALRSWFVSVKVNSTISAFFSCRHKDWKAESDADQHLHLWCLFFVSVAWDPQCPCKQNGECSFTLYFVFVFELF